jgi:hypothetical protein
MADMINARNLVNTPIEIWGGMKAGLPLANPAQAGLLATGKVSQAFGNIEGVNRTLDLAIINNYDKTTPESPAAPTTTGTPLGQGGIGHPQIFGRAGLNTINAKSSKLARSGNWRRNRVGPGQLDIVSDITAGLNSLFSVNQNQVNLVLNWTAGQKLGDALKQCLNTAFPGIKVNMGISDSLVQNHDEKGFYQTIGQLGQYIRQVSQFIMQGTMANYTGVNIIHHLGELHVFDNTASALQPGAQAAGTISVADLVGLPVWLSYDMIQVKCIMRADIKFMSQVTLPKTPIISSFINGGVELDPSLQDDRGKLVYSGSGTVHSITHYGDSRSASGDAWVTVLTLKVGDDKSGNNPIGIAGAS